MTFDFFEGAAGTGKTHSLVGHAQELVLGGILGDGHKILALTFMNGARRRLEARLRENALFRRRIDCLTFDVFARTLAARRRSLITADMRARAEALDDFDSPCCIAGALLDSPMVRRWVGRAFPLVLVDEAQDLDDHRLHVLQGLAQTSSIVAAADPFQCLTDGRDTASVLNWLDSGGQTHRLTQPRRTLQRGLLAAALALREGKDVKSMLQPSDFQGKRSWGGPGFRLLEAPATSKNYSLLAWSISNEIAQRREPFAILTPDAGNEIVRKALGTVQTRQWTRKSGGTFGPFPHTWDRHDGEEANALLDDIALPDSGSYASLRPILEPHVAHGCVVHAISRMDRLRRVNGQARFTKADVAGFIHDSFRNRARIGLRHQHGHLAMTIQRAKNREFPNVIVLWPHTATGSDEHKRRLLYNGITRAKNHCTVIVLGQGRLDAAPFAPI